MPKEPANKDRFLVEALRAISQERDIEFSSFSHDWIIRLHRDGSTHYVYGYNFDFNPAAAASIANDKSALSDILKQHGVPHVEHVLFIAPKLSKYLGSTGNWNRAMEFVERLGYPVVCKTNQGTSGNSVFKIKNQTELEAAFQRLHEVARGLALSPFYSIDAEYRVILLRGSALLCYKKERSCVTGDGRSTFFELLQSNCATEPEVLEAALEEPCFPLDEVPSEDQEITITWKHNLSKGATPQFSLYPEIQQSIVTLAQAACSATGMQFASVDVIQTGKDLKIIEVNAGVCLEHISQFSDEGRQRAMDVYTQAVDAMFALEN